MRKVNFAHNIREGPTHIEKVSLSHFSRVFLRFTASYRPCGSHAPSMQTLLLVTFFADYSKKC